MSAVEGVPVSSMDLCFLIPSQLSPLQEKCCQIITEQLREQLRTLDSYPNFYTRDWALLEALPNLPSVAYVWREIRATHHNLSFLFKLNTKLIQFNAIPPTLIFSLNESTPFEFLFTQLDQYVKQNFRSRMAPPIHLTFTSYIRGMERLPHYGPIHILHLDFSAIETERVLRQWISYLKLTKQRNSKWAELRRISIAFLPNVKILYDLLSVLPNLLSICIPKDTPIDDIPILKDCLELVSNLRYGLDDHVSYGTNYSSVVDGSLTHTLHIWYETKGNKVKGSDLRLYKIINPVIPPPLKRGNDNNKNKSGLKKPKSNLKTLFGEKI